MTQTPNDGTVLTKEQVVDYILKNLEEAKNDETDEYADFCNLFEASFGYCVDANLKYDSKQGKFIVFELTNYN
jgi:hypothetical protein